jgi:hypothetical protein
MKTETNACSCIDCIGAACTCGCQAPPAAKSDCRCGCQQGKPCQCGPKVAAPGQSAAPASPVNW